MSKCPHCGAEVQYSPEKHVVHCDYCGSDFKASELLAEYKKAKKEKDDANAPKFQGMSYTCSQCGATLLSFDETAVTFCSYCGSQNVLEDKLIEQTAPDLIIPFSKTQEECIKNYKKKINHSLFCPNYMKSDFVLKKFRGIYMPYGIYNLHFSGDCVNQGERYSHRSGDYIIYDKYDLHADVDTTYKGISYDLLSKFYDEYSQAIPFNHKEALPFNPNYLPGFYADCKDVDSDIYHEEAKNIAGENSTKYLKAKRAYAKYNCSEPKVSYKIEDCKTGLFPVYFASVQDKDKKHIHYAIINGQTGKVAADLPVDFKKYLFFSIILAFPLFFIINSFFTILPTTINLLSIGIAIIGAIIFFSQFKIYVNREKRVDDKGLSSLTKDEVVEKKKQKKKPNYTIGCLPIILSIILFFIATTMSFYYPKYVIPIVCFAFIGIFSIIFITGLIAKRKEMKADKNQPIQVSPSYLVKFVPAFVIPLATIAMNPVHDSFYYGSAIASLILTLLSFSDLIDIHNKLASRPIPQLEKRGGDESE